MTASTRPAPGAATTAAAPGPRPGRARTSLAALAASAAAHLLLLAWLARFPLPGPRPPGGPITIWKKVRLVAVG